jgi:hypothetical protein
VESPRRGKFRALQIALEAARGDVLVCVDADVAPGLDAFARLAQPILAGSADVTTARRVARPPVAGGRIERLIFAWSSTWLAAWSRVREGHEGDVWPISGELYAIRRAFFPAAIPVPLVEDASIGAVAWRAGARFRHVPSATVTIVPPKTAAEWFRQKLRTRRGFEWLSRFEPGVGSIQRALIEAVRSGPGGRTFAGRTLVWQELILRRIAAITNRLGPPPGESWATIRSTKQWGLRPLSPADAPGADRLP